MLCQGSVASFTVAYSSAMSFTALVGDNSSHGGRLSATWTDSSILDNSLAWCAPVSSRTAPSCVDDLCSVRTVQSSYSSTLSTATNTDQPSCTYTDDKSVTLRAEHADGEHIKPCSMWLCPLDQDLDTTEQIACEICNKLVNPRCMLPCMRCQKVGCVYCHLKNIAGKDFNCRHDAFLMQAACFYCRTPYSMFQLRQLYLIYRAHKKQLGFRLFSTDNDHESPDQRSELLLQGQQQLELEQARALIARSSHTVTQESSHTLVAAEDSVTVQEDEGEYTMESAVSVTLSCSAEQDTVVDTAQSLSAINYCSTDGHSQTQSTEEATSSRASTVRVVQRGSGLQHMKGMMLALGKQLRDISYQLSAVQGIINNQ